MGKLEDLRKKIDKLDDAMLKLLAERGKIVKSIGSLKSKHNEQIYASAREKEILTRLKSQNRGPLSSEAVEGIFQEIIHNCRSLESKLKVAFLGPDATFTHQAAVKQFGRGAEYIAMPSIADVFDEVEKKRADYGVVPIENSTEGVVNHTLDMFVESDLVICAEREEPISHHLLSSSGQIKKIKAVHSHPQALAQCRRWLEAHLPGVQIHEAASTADAAVKATMDSSAAAIASEFAAQHYELRVVAPQIEDSSKNYTRFLTIGRASPPPSGQDKTSILFSIKDKVGALYDILSPFKSRSINLSKIESRPTKKKPWEYIFYVDLGGHTSEPHVKEALEELKENCFFVKILGSYPLHD